jgi:hypothetical protein
MNADKVSLERWTTRTGILLVLLSFLASAAAQGLTTKDWVEKAQAWYNARDNGSFTATRTGYRIDTSGEVLASTTSVWFTDDPYSGWSYRADTTFTPGSCSSSCTYKVLSAPSGDEAFMGGTEVYPPKDDMVATFSLQPHSSMPKVFYNGNTSDTALQALTALASSTTASEEYVGSTHCFKLVVNWNNTAINSKIDSTDFQFGANDSETSTIWIRSSDGQPVREYHQATTQGTQFKYRVIWSNINTSPTIPAGTYNLTAGSPSATAQDALLTWYEGHCQ